MKEFIKLIEDAARIKYDSEKMSFEDGSDFRERLMGRCFNLTGESELAQDLFASTILRAWEKQDTFLNKNHGEFDQEDFEKWVFKICKNLNTDQNRRGKLPTQKTNTHNLDQDKSKEKKVSRIIYSNAPPDAETLGYQEYKETKKDFETCLKELSDKERNVTIENLKYSYDEICIRMNISQADLRTTISRSRDKLRLCMGYAG